MRGSPPGCGGGSAIHSEAGGDLGTAERRLEELTLQVFGTEDSMLKALTEILDIKQALDALQAHNSILKMRNELAVVKETLGQLNRGEEQQDNQDNSGTPDREGEREG